VASGAAARSCVNSPVAQRRLASRCAADGGGGGDCDISLPACSAAAAPLHRAARGGSSAVAATTLRKPLVAAVIAASSAPRSTVDDALAKEMVIALEKEGLVTVSGRSSDERSNGTASSFVQR
jgi:hypothetical protein